MNKRELKELIKPKVVDNLSNIKISWIDRNEVYRGIFQPIVKTYDNYIFQEISQYCSPGEYWVIPINFFETNLNLIQKEEITLKYQKNIICESGEIFELIINPNKYEYIYKDIYDEIFEDTVDDELLEEHGIDCD